MLARVSLVRFFITVFLSLFLLLLPKNTFAQVKNDSIATQSAQTNQYLSQFPPQSPQYANIVVINLIHTVSCMSEGYSVIGQPCIDYQPSNTNNGTSLVPVQEQLIAGGGAMGAIGNTLTTMYNTPPIYVGDYLTYARSNLNLVKPAYAQVSGSGNNILYPIFNIWMLMRNLAYVGMIFIFLVIGFMIMFRQKINPQTVLGIQQAIPGLIIGLILITFSYFLAALMVDTAFVATHLAGKVLEGQVINTDPTTNPPGNSNAVDDLLNKSNVLSIFNLFIAPPNKQIGFVNRGPTNIVGETKNVVSSLQDSDFGGILQKASATAGCLLGLQINPISRSNLTVGFGGVIELDAGKLIGGAISCGVVGGIAYFLGGTGVLGTTAGLLLYVILIIALLISMFKLLFALVGCYLTILVSTIFSPIQFLMGSIPGRSKVYTDWLKSMLANLLAFPAVFAALLFAAYILNWQGAPFYIKQDAFANFSGTMPLLGNLSTDFIRMILTYGILLLSPNIPNMVKEAFGVKGPNFGQAVIGGVVGGFGVARTATLRTLRNPLERQKIYRESLAQSEINPDRYPAPHRPSGAFGNVFSTPGWRENIRRGMARAGASINIAGEMPPRGRPGQSEPVVAGGVADLTPKAPTPPVRNDTFRFGGNANPRINLNPFRRRR